MEEKYKVSDDIEKTSHLPVPLIVFWIVFILIDVIMMISVYSHVKEDSIWFLVVWCILLLFPIWLFYWIYTTIKSSNSMKKHLENWTIIVKKPLITKFQFYYDSDVDGRHSESWYIVVASDWMETYRSKLFQRAVITWWYYKESIDKDFLQKNGIPCSPRDPKYDKDSVIRRIREIDEEIDILKEQEKSMSFFAKIKNKSKISKLNVEKDRLFPPSLICWWKKLYIWDEVEVFVDPDNPKNYEMKI